MLGRGTLCRVALFREGQRVKVAELLLADLMRISQDLQDCFVVASDARMVDVAERIRSAALDVGGAVGRVAKRANEVDSAAEVR